MLTSIVELKNKFTNHDSNDQTGTLTISRFFEKEY